METIYSDIPHIIGLGSAGTNIAEFFLKNSRTMELLKSEATRLSILTIDIADAEIKKIQETYDNIVKVMRRSGVPKERLRLIAESVKFPSAEAMFDFVNSKFKEYLINEGINLKGYIPWLPSTMAIPPLAGGAGRRRALAKAIYELNYHQLGTIKSFLNAFKEQALSSLITPIVIIIFGLGGGTGSGIVFEFTRHLRKIIGSGVPIIGLGILPCRGDDPPAKGVSAFTALNELSLLLNREYNEYICKVYGDAYQNPFNAFFFLPLTPAFTKAGNILSAREEIDEMIIDMLYVFMDFDLADLLGGIGTEVGLTENFVNTISMIKVTYPVDEYILAFKTYLAKLETLREVRREKLEILKAIYEIIKAKRENAVALYRKYLIKTGEYVEEQFDEKIQALIHSSPRFEEDYELYVRSIEEQSRNWISEIIKFLSTIKLVAKSGTIEDSIANLVLHSEGFHEGDNLESLLTHVSRMRLEFSQRKTAIFERLKQLIPSSQNLTVKQKRLLEDFMNLTELIENALNIFRFYNETRHLNEALIRYYGAIPESEDIVKDLMDERSELTTIYHVLQLMLRTPVDEAKMIDEHLTFLHGIMAKLREKRTILENEMIRIQEKKKRIEFDESRFRRELRKIFGKKKYAREQLRNLEIEKRRLLEEEAYISESIKKLDEISNQFQHLTKRIEVTSEYRRMLNRTLELDKEYQERVSKILVPKRYFERATELTESEQTKIIFKILAEQEEALSREGILQEILDMEHFRDYMKSVLRVFKTPSILGFKPSYRSDYIWVTIQTPSGLWSEDLTQELYTALAGYITGEVSRNITIRVINSRDPWIIRLLIVAGRGKVNDLESYEEMQLLYSRASDLEKQLSRSLLIEHGVTHEEIMKDFLSFKQEEIKGISKKT